jgi:hypothetical protein
MSEGSVASSAVEHPFERRFGDDKDSSSCWQLKKVGTLQSSFRAIKVMEILNQASLAVAQCNKCSGLPVQQWMVGSVCCRAWFRLAWRTSRLLNISSHGEIPSLRLRKKTTLACKVLAACKVELSMVDLFLLVGSSWGCFLVAGVGMHDFNDN